mmetsp:Transcript_11332/g.31585  ORF Transcript_11332/g.31585 Transcript_11332/m.31585 type:complete len:90 (-) Transcript_11332:273-542(-)
MTDRNTSYSASRTPVCLAFLHNWRTKEGKYAVGERDVGLWPEPDLIPLRRGHPQLCLSRSAQMRFHDCHACSVQAVRVLSLLAPRGLTT